MYGLFDGVFIGAEPELLIEKEGKTYKVQNCTFQELDEQQQPIPGRYLVVEVWNEKLEKIKDWRLGERLNCQVEIITRRKHNKTERYRNRITLVDAGKF